MTQKHPDYLTVLMRYAREREDRWRTLQRDARTALRHPSAKATDGLRRELSALRDLEEYWAFPGPAVIARLFDALSHGDMALLDTALGNISAALHTKSYRRTPDLDLFVHHGPLDEAMPMTGSTDRPYFEVLTVTTATPEDRAEMSAVIRLLRSPTDDFVYESVIVDSVQDALLALVVNPEIQAVVAHDGFPFHSRHNLPHLEEFLTARGTQMTGDLALQLLAICKEIRPEVDRYLLSDRDWDRVAGSDAASDIRRIFFGVEEVKEVHLSVLDGVRERFQTPFFDNLKAYARRPMGTYHALPIARGKSIFKSNWIRDMGEFYGENLFMAESSATTGGLDSLLEPTGNIKKAQQLAAKAFGADHAYFVTNGTSTANKIVGQAVCKPGDIVLIDRDCHKSHHYACVLSGAQPYYVDAFALPEYSMYGGVPIANLKAALLELAAAGQLDRVRMVILTNATFDGHMSHTVRTMMECLAIKSDLVFLWDEAWSAAARFSPYLRPRTAMGAVPHLRSLRSSEAYRERYAEWRELAIAVDGSDPQALVSELLPDPDAMEVRVYQTTSVHKSMSALRQASMILVADQEFGDIEENFKEAFYTHTSTSPNQQIIASLDVARRQMVLEGYELISGALDLAMDMRRLINTNPLISRYFRALTPIELIPAQYRTVADADRFTWSGTIAAVVHDEFTLDRTRVTVTCGLAGLNGAEFKQLLADKYEIQINKTSRNSVLFQLNINNTRGDLANVIQVLADISRDIDERLRAGSDVEREDFQAKVVDLVENTPELPNFSSFHDAFRDDPTSPTRHGHIREAYYLAYDADNCEHLRLDDPELDRRLAAGEDVVGANFVIPYPPGFPVIVPGQVVTPEIIAFMRALDVTEIHGYDPVHGLKLFRAEALAAAAATS
ncbi:MAG: aminotransferase class I/II-fold pyridoxal phosphate-dependent enzyme [Candidatus Nanopelagicales bacterium]